MSMRIRMDTTRFKEQLRATVDELHAATRPAAQEGIQIIYDRAKQLVPVSEEGHWFYGSSYKKTGQKYFFNPGSLRDAIYQVFSKDKSFKDKSTYHVSWNQAKAPYGWMVELGTSRMAARSFLGKAIAETRSQVREAVKRRFIEEVSK